MPTAAQKLERYLTDHVVDDIAVEVQALAWLAAGELAQKQARQLSHRHVEAFAQHLEAVAAGRPHIALNVVMAEAKAFVEVRSEYAFPSEC